MQPCQLCARCAHQTHCSQSCPRTLPHRTRLFFEPSPSSAKPDHSQPNPTRTHRGHFHSGCGKSKSASNRISPAQLALAASPPRQTPTRHTAERASFSLPPTSAPNPNNTAPFAHIFSLSQIPFHIQRYFHSRQPKSYFCHNASGIHLSGKLSQESRARVLARSVNPGSDARA